MEFVYGVSQSVELLRAYRWIYNWLIDYRNPVYIWDINRNEWYYYNISHCYTLALTTATSLPNFKTYPIQVKVSTYLYNIY